MKKIMLAALAALSMFGVAASSAYAADGAALADRHAKMGVKCEQCHATKSVAPGARPTNDACFACHKDYATLAKRTEKLDPNPHKTHLGNVRCADCHSGHGQSRLMCNDCHKFDLKVK